MFPFSIALENDVANALVDYAVWQSVDAIARFDMQSIVTRHTDGGSVPTEKAASRASLPISLPVGSALAHSPSHLLPSALGPADKRVLDLIADWPGITPANLRAPARTQALSLLADRRAAERRRT